MAPYEAWVAGVDPVTGVPKGRLRRDDRAVRFVEVVVNGPKSWSLAAELHPDISRAYDVAQQRAATQIIGWLAEHATSRVGPRGAQVQVPVAEIEAVTVAHHTSRAGDPHRHVHLQINAVRSSKADSVSLVSIWGCDLGVTADHHHAVLVHRGDVELDQLDPAGPDPVAMATQFAGLLLASGTS